MSRDINIIVENKLEKEKRGINVYHHAGSSAHIISHDNSIKIPLGTAGEGDYLHISLVRGPGNFSRECLLSMPSWADLEFSLEGKLTIIHNGDRTILKIPAGPPAWQLKMTRPAAARCKQKPGNITINDGAANE